MNHFNWITKVIRYLGKSPIEFAVIVLRGTVVAVIPERMKGVTTGIGFS